jgi:hypothetical protein
VTLVPDLAFVGLIEDTIDATRTAQDLVKGTRPYRAYSMVRVAFEAAQRLLVLATAEDYVRLATRAWLYYRAKDAALKAESRQARDIPAAGQDIVDLWTKYFPAAQEIIVAERESLAELRGPDNFLGRDLADACARGYEIIAAASGGTATPDAAATDRSIYRSLCRESHACVRLRPRGIRVDADGFVEIVEHERSRADVEVAVVSGLDVSLQEANVAVDFRLRRRQAEHVVELRSAHRGDMPALPADYFPDFGTYLLEHGVGHTTMSFPGVALRSLRELPDGTIRNSLSTKLDETRFLATFDIKGQARKALLDRIEEEFPGLMADQSGARPPLRLNLPVPLTVTLTAVLGRLERNGAEQFIPLIVVGIDECRGPA